MALSLAQLLAEGTAQLRAAGALPHAGALPDLEAQLLLAHATGLPRSRLQSHGEQAPAPQQVQAFRALLARRAAGEPLAYLTGEKEFWSLTLRVTPAVLVPRPETELLVERALALGPPQVAEVADLGTGSGAIALALARERPLWQVQATDSSAAALEVARANAQGLRLGNVTFAHGSWFEPLGQRRYALLVSNPPYVASTDAALTALRHEPQLALSGGPDGLAGLRALIAGAGAHLRAGGWLLLEHGATQGAAVRHALVLAGFAHVRSHRDLAGLERMTEGQHGQI